MGSPRPRSALPSRSRRLPLVDRGRGRADRTRERGSGRQALAAARASGVQHLAAADRFHARAKPVSAFPNELARLIGPLHVSTPILAATSRLRLLETKKPRPRLACISSRDTSRGKTRRRKPPRGRSIAAQRRRSQFSRKITGDRRADGGLSSILRALRNKWRPMNLLFATAIVRPPQPSTATIAYRPRHAATRLVAGQQFQFEHDLLN